MKKVLLFMICCIAAAVYGSDVIYYPEFEDSVSFYASFDAASPDADISEGREKPVNVVGKLKFASLLIYVFIVGNDVDHFGYIHLVRAARNDLLDTAFDTQWRLFDNGGCYDGGFAGSESHLFELVVVASRAYTTPVCGEGGGGVGEIDDKLHVALDDVGRVAFWTYGDVTHGRIGANSARPCNSDDVILLFA